MSNQGQMNDWGTRVAKAGFGQNWKEEALTVIDRLLCAKYFSICSITWSPQPRNIGINSYLHVTEQRLKEIK